VDVLANEAGDRITPAIVSITDEETVSLIFFTKFKLAYKCITIYCRLSEMLQKLVLYQNKLIQ